MEEKSMWNGAVIASLVVGLVIGFGAGVAWYKAKIKVPKEKAVETAKVEDVKDEEIAEASDEVVVVEAQKAGESVTVKSVAVDEATWVAVREDKDGSLGNILGARRIEAGTQADVVVELLRPTLSGSTYHVVVYRDIEAPSFNYKEDVLVEGVDKTFIAE